MTPRLLFISGRASRLATQRTRRMTRPGGWQRQKGNRRSNPLVTPPVCHIAAPSRCEDTGLYSHSESW